MNNHSHTTWILVAHIGGAVVYESRGRLPLVDVIHIRGPRGRLHGDGRHALSTQESASEHIARAFVADLVERLERFRAEASFDRLVLVAPPRMLSRLHSALPEALRALLIATLPEDLAHSDGARVRQQLVELV